MKEKKKIKGVIFDLDGVILDSMIIWKDLGCRYIRACGKEPEEQLSSILFSMSMEEGAAYLMERYELSKTPDQIGAELGQMLEDFYYDEVELKPGVVELLSFLKAKEIPLVAATSSMRYQVERALKRNRIDVFFSEILTTAEVGESKHHPQIYYLAADSLAAKPEEILVFEDSLYALVTAKKAGFITMGLYDKYGEENQTELKKASDLYLIRIDEAIDYINNPI